MSLHMRAMLTHELSRDLIQIGRARLDVLQYCMEQVSTFDLWPEKGILNLDDPSF